MGNKQYLIMYNQYKNALESGLVKQINLCNDKIIEKDVEIKELNDSFTKQREK